MIEYVKTFKEKNNQLMALRVGDKNLIETYKTIWANSEDLKILN